MRIGIFGGTFNPIHYGHLRIAEEAKQEAGLDQIILMPAGNPPLKTENLCPAQMRYEMTGLAAAHNEAFSVSAVEKERKGKSYTIDTVRKLKRLHPGDELFLILGVDAFLDIPNWLQPEKLVGLVDFIVVERPGYRLSEIKHSPLIANQSTGTDSRDRRKRTGVLTLVGGKKVFPLQATRLEISSTEIRAMLKQGISVKYLLPEAVEKYIYAHNLYGSGK